MPNLYSLNRGATGNVVQQIPGNAVADTDVSVTTSDTALVAANTNRRFLAIVNTGSGHIRIRFGQASTTGTGIQLRANGGSIVFDRIVPVAAVNAISETGTNAVCVTEF